MLTVENIAAACHEVNRAFCRGMLDFSQEEWEKSPYWMRESAMAGVRFQLGLIAKGETPAQDASHKAWLAHKEKEGWTWGPEKRPDLLQHPCFLPYEQLPEHERIKDTLFISVVRGLVSCHGMPSDL